MNFLEKLIIGVMPAIVTSILSYYLGKNRNRSTKRRKTKEKSFLSFFDENYNSFFWIAYFATIWYVLTLIWSKAYGNIWTNLPHIFPPIISAYCCIVLCIKAISSGKKKRRKKNDDKGHTQGDSNTK